MAGLGMAADLGMVRVREGALGAERTCGSVCGGMWIVYGDDSLYSGGSWGPKSWACVLGSGVGTGIVLVRALLLALNRCIWLDKMFDGVLLEMGVVRCGR